MSPFWITMLIVALAAACAESYRCGVERGWRLGVRDAERERDRTATAMKTKHTAQNGGEP